MHKKNNPDNRQNSTNINWFPGHMQKTKRLIRENFSLIDLVYEVIDARIPLSSKIKGIKELIKNKPVLLIMTKKDLCEIKVTKKWQDYYESLGYQVLLVDLNDPNDCQKIITKTYDIMAEFFQKKAQKGIINKEIKALVIGIPNVGKSTLINKLVGKKVTQVANRPGVTTNLNWLKTKGGILLLDTPGILWPKLEAKKEALNLAAMNAIKSEILDKDEIAVYVLQTLEKYYPEILQQRYDISSCYNLEETYYTIGKNIGAIKNNEVIYEKVSERILSDLKNGYLKEVTFDHEI